MHVEVKVRPCLPSDAPAAAELIALSMGDIGAFLMGAGDAEKARRVFAALAAKRGSRFSHEFADVADLEGRTVGIGLGYPAGLMKGTHIPTALQMVRVLGAPGFVRFLLRTRPLVGSKEAEPGEFYVTSLATSPDVQGRGIGKLLMARLEQRAVESGCRRCALLVDVVNRGARGFYERCGYRTLESLEFESLRRRIGYEGCHRMVKAL